MERDNQANDNWITGKQHMQHMHSTQYSRCIQNSACSIHGTAFYLFGSIPMFIWFITIPISIPSTDRPPDFLPFGKKAGKEEEEYKSWGFLAFRLSRFFQTILVLCRSMKVFHIASLVNSVDNGTERNEQEDSPNFSTFTYQRTGSRR